MNRHDPRIRQTINRLTETLETANLNTQASLFSFSESYVQPCLNSLSTCLESSCYPCFGARRDRARARQRHLSRGGARRPELVFDFYNDEWDEEEGETSGLLSGWGADELDRILAGSGSDQPRRQARMNYGTRGVGARRRSIGTKSGEVDPTILPGSSMFGFLERLPWKIGGRGVRYKPSAADLQENPGGRKGLDEAEGEALLEDSEENVESADAQDDRKTHRRIRSSTNASQTTTNSLSSRGDLFPSEDEADAVPIDDEFAINLGRRSTNESASGKSRARRSATSRTTAASKDTRSVKSGDGAGSNASVDTPSVEEASAALENGLPTMEDLKREEEDVKKLEQEEVDRKRAEARRVALERGLVAEEDEEEEEVAPTSATTEPRTGPPETGVQPEAANEPAPLSLTSAQSGDGNLRTADGPEG